MRAGVGGFALGFNTLYLGTNLVKHMKPHTSSGKISTILLILAAVLIVVIVVIFFVIKISAGKNATTTKPTTDNVVKPEEPKPVYEFTMSGIRFIVESAMDMGSIITSSNPQVKSLFTTEKFIKVTISGQNMGKFNTSQHAWSIGNIVDADGRNFLSIDNAAYRFLPNPNLCGSVLKPAFESVLCVHYYEVAKTSKGFKIQISAVLSGSKKQEAYLDLPIK